MGSDDKKKSVPWVKRRYFFAGIILWTIIIGASLAWNIFDANRHSLKAARIEARTIFERNVIFRRWGAMHGGVYIAASGDIKPNPYLADIPERDIITPSGRTLTLLNPAYMMRQTYELAEQEHGLRERLVSLEPINPENLPDEWERRALQGFGEDPVEANSLQSMDGVEYMRLIRPIEAVESCYLCHDAWKGSEVGINAGLSISVPMAPFRSSFSARVFELFIGHLALWLAGVAGLVVCREMLKRSEEKRKIVEGALRESEEHFSTVFKESPVGMFVIDMEGGLKKVNSSLSRILDCSMDELDVTRLKKCIWPESSLDEASLIFEKMFLEGRPFYRVEKGCEKCGGEMIVRSSRRGPFLGCAGFPKCRNAKPIPKDAKEGDHIDFREMAVAEEAADKPEKKKKKK